MNSTPYRDWHQAASEDIERDAQQPQTDDDLLDVPIELVAELGYN
jgi:hypothetical protein